MGALSIEQMLAEEAAAIHGQSQRERVQTLRDLATNQTFEAERLDKDADIRSGKDERPEWSKNRKAFYCELGKLNRAALCCSGGGIRSATFCLGVIQALAMLPHPKSTSAKTPRTSGNGDDTRKIVRAVRPEDSLLSCFHYLSTVSGGGYIGSWLSAWRHRNDFPAVWKSLSGRPEGPDVEPPEISWLRSYSNYLTPRVGIFSADTWADLAIYLRNLLLNWLIIVPALAVAVLVLKFVVTFSVMIARLDHVWWPHFIVLLIGIALLIRAQAFTTRHRPTRRKAPDAAMAADPLNTDRMTFLLHGLLPALLSAVFVTGFLTSIVGAQLAAGFGTFGAIAVGAGLSVFVFAGGWLAGNPVRVQCKDFWLWTASGLVYGGLLGFGAYLFTLLSPYMGGDSVWIILIPVILGVPWVLVAQLLAEMVFVGLVSYEVNSDADREWLGRAAGWIAATAVVWMVTTVIVFAGGYVLIGASKEFAAYVASAGGITAVLTAWLGKSAKTLAKPSDDKQSNKSTFAANVGLAIAGPLFAAILVVGVSVALDLLLLGGSLIGGLSSQAWSYLYVYLWLTIGLAAAFAIAAIASRSVNINRFSIHALYRNRLVRAYLGASRQERHPDRFTGFDGADNVAAHKLWPPRAEADGTNSFSLFHVVNITLNVVKSTRLAWQQRKAESFTASPTHCGTAYTGFRPSDEYAGGKPYGISLGTAMAISGAAASPNMGYHSSPSVTLLLALFNVRLGWWLGNPGPKGNETYTKEGPATAIRPLIEETFGLTTDQSPWVYLSDGGHFENLGIYEMVRRRCRFILAVDAGCDPDFAFEDLGNALRKIYIDLGIRIRFQKLDQLRNRPSDEYLRSVKDNIPYYAIGTIKYSEADGPDCENGVILYVKPAYHGTSKTEGAGVRSYATMHKAFPHEPTADQWFSESQFESYRSLALDIMSNVLQGEEPFPDESVDVILSRLTPTDRA